MRLALLADLHIGYGFRKTGSDPRKEDSFDNAASALRLAAENADAILIAGDLFDRPDISTEIFLRALEIFDIPRSRDSEVLVNGKPWNGIPVLAIRGNHDVSTDLNRHPVLLLDRAHRLKYLNAERVVLQKGNERVAVTGAGWVPDKKPKLAQDYFAKRVPPPLPGVFNVLMLHQPLEGIGRYPGETPLPISALPPGYDVYHSGHLHWHIEKRVSDRWIVIPGSTVRTQLTDREVEDDRAFWILNTESGTLDEVEIPSARRGRLVRVNVAGLAPSDVVERVRSGIESTIRENDREKAPIVKIVLEGSTYDVYDLSSIVSEYEGKAIVKVFDRTASAVVEALANVTMDSFRGEEIFSREFAMSVLRSALESSGVSPGARFEEFYSLLASAGRVSKPEDRDLLIQRVETLISSGAVSLSKNGAAGTELGAEQSGQVRRPAGSTILDWAEP